MAMRIVTLDCETTIRNKGGSLGSPFYSDNFVVLWGWKINKLDVVTSPTLDIEFSGNDILVGHNIKFDLQWLRRNSYEKFMQISHVWDTQIAEYMITCQEHLYASLNEVSQKYGGTLKPDIIKNYWEAGIDTTDIPHKELVEYLIGDVENTYLVFQAQRAKMQKMGFNMKYVFAYMRSVLCVSDMEYNGMCVNVKVIENTKNELEEKLRHHVSVCMSMLPEGIPFNLNSNQHLQAILFGGTITWETKEYIRESKPYKVFKCGELESKRRGDLIAYSKENNIPITHEFYTNPIHGLVEHTAEVNVFKLTPKPEWKNKTGIAVGEDVLQEIANETQLQFVKTLLDIRWLNKQINTYCTGMLEIQTDGVIHHNLNQCSTVTSRLSCVAPHTRVLTDTGYKRIDEIILGDLVYTHKGRFKPVIAIIKNPPDDIYEVRFCNGNVLTCNSTHKLLSSKGKWVTIKQIMEDTGGVFKVLGIQERKHTKSYRNVSKKRTVNYSKYSRFNGNKLPQCYGGFETIYGKGRIRCLKKTSLHTIKNRAEKSNVGQVWRESSRVCGSGIGLQRVSYLYPQWEKAVCPQGSDDERAWAKFLTVASGSSSHRRKPIKQRIGQFSSLHKNRASGNSRTTGYGKRGYTVKEITYKGSSEVYDLTVLDDHSYLTEGVFSHNCTKPNLQNIPAEGESPVKLFFVSRFGEDGYIVNIDYSQLEVVWQAFVTQDKNMIADLILGTDFHCKRLALKENMSYEEVVKLCKVDNDPVWLNKRKKIKSFSFQRAYGAGAKAISLSTGIPEDEVKVLIENEKQAYPRVEQYFNECVAEIKASMRRNTHTTEKGLLAGTGYLRSITTRGYHFKQYDAPSYSKEPLSFSPTQIRNYPIQGGATGDLVPLMMTKLFFTLRQFPEYGKEIFMINQVHDSIMLDIHKKHLDIVAKTAKQVLESVDETFKSLFGISFNVPIKVDVEYGTNWKQQQEYK